MAPTTTAEQQAANQIMYKVERAASAEIRLEVGGSLGAYYAFRDAEDRGLVKSARRDAGGLSRRFVHWPNWNGPAVQTGPRAIREVHSPYYSLLPTN
jgi:hypothetical protein